MLNDPRFTAEVELTIPFHDVDMMGVVWHGNYFRYFEIAREALLNQFNYGYRQMKESGYLWPVVDTRVKYRDVLTFEQRFRVRARLEEEAEGLMGSRGLHDRLTQLDPVSAERIDPHNARRIIRALEVIELTGRRYSASMPSHEFVAPSHQFTPEAV